MKNITKTIRIVILLGLFIITLTSSQSGVENCANQQSPKSSTNYTSETAIQINFTTFDEDIPISNGQQLWYKVILNATFQNFSFILYADVDITALSLAIYEIGRASCRERV